MTGCQNRLTLLIILPVGTWQITVATYNLLLFRIPYNQLLIAILTDIEFIDIDLLTGATACLTESNLAQTADFLHNIWRIMCRNNIDFIVALVRHAQLLVWSQFAFEQFFVNRLDNGLFHWFTLIIIGL